MTGLLTDGPGFVHLTDEELAGLGIGSDEAVAAVEDAIRGRRRGEIRVAPKSVIEPGDGRYLMSTLGVTGDPSMTVVKSVVLNPRNPPRGLSGINATIVMLDGETGILKAVMQANWITAVRTAALSAVAARRFADPAAHRIAFLGTGAQARAHLDTFADLFPLEEVAIAGRGRANIDRLAAAAEKRGLRARIPTDPHDALSDADIVVSSVLATYDGPPLANARWLKSGAFATITDLARPWDRAGMGAFDTIVIDDLEQEAAMAEPMVAPELVAGDLDGLVNGDVSAGHDPDRRSALVFRGVAIGDVALAGLAYARAVTSGIGHRIER